MADYQFKAKVWLYDGPAAWHFVTLSKKLSAKIKKDHPKRRNAWGSIKVEVTAGDTSWSTSIFPDTKKGAYVLPLKAEIRRKEKIAVGDQVNFNIKIGK